MPSLLNQSLFELIKANKSIGNEELCHQFATKLWGELAELPLANPLVVDQLKPQLMAAEGHKLFWLGLDAVGHHLLLEKCNGLWRVFQTFVKQWNFGYTANEWCYGDMRKKSAWLKFGGGRIISNKEVGELLDLVIEWQSVVKIMLKRILLNAVPNIDPKAIPFLKKAPRDVPNAEIMKLCNDASMKIQQWSNAMRRRIAGPEGCTTIGVEPPTWNIEEG